LLQSNYLLASAITAGLATIINGAVLFLVLSRGRQKRHYLFAAVLALYTIGGLGVFLFFIRNSHLDELIIYSSINFSTILLVFPCIYHFTCTYLNQTRKKSTIFIWVFTVVCVIFLLLDRFFLDDMATKVVHYDWGNQIVSETTGGIISSIVMVIFLSFIWAACWLLFRARRRETSTLARRHMQYILISFLVISFFYLTLFLPTELSGRFLVSPIRGLVGSAFAAVIGIAIVKERLFDITIIIKKTTIYSILLALVIFIFSLSEHLLATYVMGFFGGHSIIIHIISIAVVVAIIMPIRSKVERGIERLFAQKKVEF
jgi:hypothetical protein